MATRSVLLSSHLTRSLCLAVAVLLIGGGFAGVDAGLRTRALPSLQSAIEPALVARAASTDRAEMYVLVEAERGSKQSLASAGVRLLRPVDGDLWLASVPAARLASGALPDAVLRAWDLTPEDRIQPELAAALRGREASVEPVRLRVKLFSGESLDGIREEIRAGGGEIYLEVSRFGFLDAEVLPAHVHRLTEREEIRWIEPAPPPYETTNNDMRMDAEVNAVHSLGLDGTGVVIGMWDSGVPDSLHPDLAGRITAAEPALFTTLHPTHVAGVAIGDGTNSVNEGGEDRAWRGVATNATLVSYGVPDAILEVHEAINTFDIDLTNNSWVYPVNEDTLGNCALYGNYTNDAPEFDSIVRGAFGKKVSIVVAAGNERDDGDCGIVLESGYGTVPPPGTGKNSITVGAHYSDVEFMTPFSSWGPTDDGRMKPDISAPGCQQFDDHGIKSTGIFGGVYTVLCGTSQATPVISGSIAILIQDWRAHFSGDPRPATLKALLGGFAQDRANPGPDYRFGLGAIDLESSVTELRTATTIEAEIGFGETDTQSFFVPPGTSSLTVTMAWDDPPGAELADTVLVNDLNLRLIDPVGTLHFPFVLDPENPERDATTGNNRLDNVEQVRVISPTPGEWDAWVFGFGVVASPQEYSLVGFDKRPPSDPASFLTVALGDTTIAVIWVRPGDADRAGTLAARSMAEIAWTPQDGEVYEVGSEPVPGVVILAADDLDRSLDVLRDEPLLPGTTYHYSVFSYDEVPNYSPGLSGSATTSGMAVSSPVLVAADRNRVTFRNRGPNPFRDRTEFQFELPGPRTISIDVFDASGRHVANVIRGERKAGSHRAVWNGLGADGRPVAAGIYFARFQAPGHTATEKLLRLR